MAEEPVKKPTAANQGKEFENQVRADCKLYRGRKVALFTKIPDPIKVTAGGHSYDQLGNRRWDVKKAVPDKDADKSVDFIGIWKAVGMFCFDCKETQDTNKFPLDNVEVEQVQYMRDFEEMGGKAFLLIRRHIPPAEGNPRQDNVYVLPFAVFWLYWEAAGRAKLFGSRPKDVRQSVPFDEIRRWPEVRCGRGLVYDFLPAVAEAFEMLAAA